MTTNKTNNMFPFLSEEMERVLRLRAWKDEFFREALIADPKGVIQRLFPQCFPNGKVSEQLTIKVIEEDPNIRHIVLPFLPDEFATPEIPEEEQVEFLANMGIADGPLRRTDSSEKWGAQLPEKRTPSFLEQESKRGQQAAETKENIPVSGDRHDLRESAKRLTIQEFGRVLQNEEFQKKFQELKPRDQERVLQILVEKYQHSQDITYKLIEDTPDTHHIVLPRLPDTPQNSSLPEGRQLGPDGRSSNSCSKRCCDTKPNPKCK